MCVEPKEHLRGRLHLNGLRAFTSTPAAAPPLKKLLRRPCIRVEKNLKYTILGRRLVRDEQRVRELNKCQLLPNLWNFMILLNYIKPNLEISRCDMPKWYRFDMLNVEISRLCMPYPEISRFLNLTCNPHFIINSRSQWYLALILESYLSQAVIYW